MPKVTRIGWLRFADPKAWEAEIKRAMKDAETIAEAAKTLDISPRYLHKWLAEIDPDQKKIKRPPPGRRAVAKK